MKDQAKENPSKNAGGVASKGADVVESVHAQGGGSYRQNEDTGEFERTGGTKSAERPLHKSTKAAADAKAHSKKE